jgi:hypothetical protein
MAETDFWQTLSNTIHRAINLRVTTMIGDVVVKGPLDQLEVDAPTTPSSCLVTDINLVGGDITRVISEKLLGAEYADLRSAHQDSVRQAQDIVERNVKILISIVKEIGDDIGKLPPPTTAPTPPAGE